MAAPHWRGRFESKKILVIFPNSYVGGSADALRP